MSLQKFNTLIGQNCILEALHLLKDANCADAPLLIGRLNRLNSNVRQGVLSYESSTIERNRIVMAAMEEAKKYLRETATPIDNGISVYVATPQQMAEFAQADENAVSNLELLLAQPLLSTVSQLPSLSARLNDVAQWLEAYGEIEFDDLAMEFRSVAKTAGKNRLEQQAGLFQEARELCQAVVELTIALREPTGTAAIIAKGKAAGSSEEEIIAAAKAISEEKLAEVKLILSQGSNEIVARIKARRIL